MFDLLSNIEVECSSPIDHRWGCSSNFIYVLLLIFNLYDSMAAVDLSALGVVGFSELTTLLAAAFALIPAARNVRRPSWSSRRAAKLGS